MSSSTCARDDEHDPGDPPTGVSPRSTRWPPPPAASWSPRATWRSPPRAPGSPSPAARAGCSATPRSSPSPATSVASGRWRWRSPATSSTPTTAAEWGLINRAVPDDELDAAVDDLIRRGDAGSVLSKALGKRGVLRPDRPRPGRGVRVRDRADGVDRRDAGRPGRASTRSSRSASRSSRSERLTQTERDPVAAVADRAGGDLEVGGDLSGRPRP